MCVEPGALRLSGTVVDGDGSLGSRSRLTLLLVDRHSKSTLASSTTRLRPDASFDVRLALPVDDPDVPPARAWDVKVSFGALGPLRGLGALGALGALGRLRPARRRKAQPVEVPPALELPPLDGARRLYRTRHGNLSLRPEAGGSDGEDD